MTYKKVQMNPDELATMLQGFIRKLFTFPREREMYTVTVGNGNCDIYFETSFLASYISELEKAREMGKFANSNANSRWLRLLSTVSEAVNAQIPSDARDYSVIISHPW